MNLAISFVFSACFVMPISHEKHSTIKAASPETVYAPAAETQAGHSRITAVEFKNQQYCRADLEDFDFDARFSIVSATVYFSGCNFPVTQTATLTSSSLKPISKLKEKCVPGTIVLFDNIKVSGPDNAVRTIEPVSYLLY